jgi:hypothetical protein
VILPGRIQKLIFDILESVVLEVTLSDEHWKIDESFTVIKDINTVFGEQ